MVQLDLRMSFDTSGLDAAIARLVAQAARSIPAIIDSVQDMLAAIGADAAAAVRFVDVSTTQEVRYLVVPSPFLVDLLNAMESAHV